MPADCVTEQLKAEVSTLRMRLEEAEATLEAIRTGEVDAVVVGGVDGQRVYTLEGAEQFYRVLIERMQQGAATLGADGTILYCNRALAAMVNIPQEKVAGTRFQELVVPTDLAGWQEALKQARSATNGTDIQLAPSDRAPLPVYLALYPLPVYGAVAIGMVLTDLTDQKRQMETDRRLMQVESARIAAQEVATQAKRSESVLRESEERFRTLAVSSPMVVWTNLPDGSIDYVNQHWFDLTGQDPDEFRRTPGMWQEALHPDDRVRAREVFERSVQAGKPFEMEVRLRRAADGAYRWHLNRAVPLRNAEGAVVKFIGTSTDIDNLKQSEEQIRFQARLLDAVGQAAIATDAAGTILYWNRFAESLYGWSSEEAIGRNIVDLVVPASGAEAAADVFVCLQGGQRWSGEFVVQRRDGTTFTAFLSDTPILDANGMLKVVIGISSDISEQKRVEQALRFLADASATLATVVDWHSTLQNVASLAVPYFADWCAVDMVEANDCLRRLAVAHVDPVKVKLAHELESRYPPDLNAPRGAYHVMRTGQSEMAEEIPDALLIAGARDEEHLRILRELGLKSYMCVPIRTREKVLGVMSFVSAESGRRYTSSDLAFAEELARRAAVSLENAQLYAELREADRLKDEFLAMLAHELRNPLAPIRNSLHIMKQPGTDREIVQEMLDMAERQVQHMARLLDDLMDVSRISRGKIELRREIVDLKHVVSRTIEAVRPLVEERRHELTVSLPPAPVRVKGDLTRLEQVVTNLLHNSAKYTDAGGHITLKVSRNGSEAVLSVQDDGIGIAPEMLPRIFDLFVQAERRVDRSQGGIGIGLTLVRRLVELHGGAIEARSAGLGQGSEFVVRLPVNDEPAPGGDASHFAAGANGNLPRRRILVVDDNQDAANSLAVLLRLAGHEVRSAYDGATALALAADFRPALVLLDIGMPEMDGYTVARRLRENAELGPLVLVALTGWGQHEDRRRSKQAGFDHHLVKPVDPAMLVRLLSSLR
jgi:PAS domain S-box-containing protein